jgi:hypothetical protein
VGTESEARFWAAEAARTADEFARVGVRPRDLQEQIDEEIQRTIAYALTAIALHLTWRAGLDARQESLL